MIMGLPSSGKTTFLGALGYMLQSDREFALRLLDANDMAYIDSISEKWVSCEKIPHTNEKVHEEITLELERRDGSNFELILPDQAGEAFQEITFSSEKNKAIQKSVKESQKLFLFIAVFRIHPEKTLAEMKEKYRKDRCKSEDKGSKEQGTKKKAKMPEFKMSEQAQHIELLQTVLLAKKEVYDLSVILSAWDMMGDKKRKPEEVLKDKMPLLWQFLVSHRDRWDIHYWGISAQGGRIEGNKNDKDRLLEMECEDRIMVVDSEGKQSNDITQILM